MPPTTKKRAAPPSDFKRIKAKVGKKAPKPANYTDTSFQKASLHVASQQQTQTLAGGVHSSRGKSLATLAQQLGHSTASIRQAAAKGVLDIVKHDGSWQNHLGTVLPALGHCLLDTESTVRSTGLSIWQALVEQASQSSLKPFWSVFMAFLSSALNALDRRVRRDARVVVESASRQVPGLMAPFTPTLLPALLRLTEDPAFQYHHQVTTTDTSVKRNRNGRQVWLETLTAVLQTLRPKDEIGLIDHQSTQPWSFTPGIVSKNSLFVSRDKGAQVKLLSMKQWWLPEAGLGETQPTITSLPEQVLSEDLVKDVWTKLRDLCLEILESNNMDETLTLWSNAVQAWLDCTTNNGASDTCERLVVQIQGLVSSHDASPSLLQGSWMLTLARLSQSLPQSTEAARKSAWIPRVVVFLLDNEQGELDTTIRWQLWKHLLDDPIALKSKSGRKVIEHMVKNWDERNLSLAPRLYAVTTAEDRQRLLQCIMDFCVTVGSAGDESIIAWRFNFILDNTRDPSSIPGDLMDRFKPLWEKDIVAEYKDESTQRLAVTLLVHLISGKSVPNDMLTTLSRLCARSVKGSKPCISKAVAAFIQDAIFDMRKNMALPSFLAFVMDGTGVRSNSSTVDDAALQNAASYLLGSGVSSQNILKMLWPLWQTWLEAKYVATKRAALSFLAVLSIDIGSQHFLRDSLPVAARPIILQALIAVLQDQKRSASSSAWFQPVVALLCKQTWLWDPLLQTCAQDLSAIEPLLVYNIRDILREAIPPTTDDKVLLQKIQGCAEKLEEEAKDGPLRNATRELSDCVKAMVAIVPSGHKEYSNGHV